MQRTIALALLLAFLITMAAARTTTAPEILGIRLGMKYATAHARLTKLAHFKSEDEGQEVWTLNHDKYYQYAIVGFDRERKVRYVTVLARPDGQPVTYEQTGDIAQAMRTGQSGNLRYTWKLKDEKEHFEYVAIAAGKDAHRLDRFSVKLLGAKGDDDDDERETRRSKK